MQKETRETDLSFGGLHAYSGREGEAKAALNTEGLLLVALSRVRGDQAGGTENAQVIEHLEKALLWLNRRGVSA